MSKNIYFSDERYLAALKRIRDLIVGGLQFIKDDDNTPGNKHTECSWGLCSENKQAWPDSEDHLWPDQFLNQGRVAPKYLKIYQRCPLNMRVTSEMTMNGCFYTCSVFKNKGVKFDRNEVISRYNEQIACIEQKIKRSNKRSI